ncbi:uncharacterized protein LOC143177261 [Calliopsis andreniformis]|uniref:uncharacterized protein LOC143177261 n=1 Tax=Calliopsis andreniformis TaxID=337506 RepID=UPI003FCD45FF
MAAYNLKSPDDVKEYLKNLHIEYKFGCYSEKNPEACHLLGDYTEAIKQDFNEATKIYKNNCDERNYGRSCTKYGDYNVIGRGCEKDFMQAYKYMKRGCELNDGIGCHHAGAFAVSNEKLEDDRSVQVADGIAMLRKGCDANIEKACFHLSGIFLSGIEGHVEKNLKEAYKLSLKCCEFGNPYACANASLMHRNGDGVQKNEELAHVFKKRAETLMDEMKNYKRQLKFQQGFYLALSILSNRVVKCYRLELKDYMKVAGDEPSKSTVDVGLYYESLCGDSIRWIKEVLKPSYDSIKDYVNINFVPYGKATQTRDPQTGLWVFSCQHGSAECDGNIAQACAIHVIKNEESAEKVQQLTVSLVICAMTSRYPPSAVPKCADHVGLTQQSKDKIKECIASSLGGELLAANGDKTAALNPPLTFVPTITINGVVNKDVVRASPSNSFVNQVCAQLQEGTKPSLCSNA